MNNTANLPNRKSIPLYDIRAGAEPFFFSGNRTGILCIHGLGAAPQEMYWLGKDMAKLGYTVLGPRLSEHGSDFALMRHARWQEWYMDVLDGYALLQQCCDSIYVIGLSLGGLLSLLLAAHKPVAGLVVLAAPYELDNRIYPYSHILRYILRQVSHYDRASDPLNAYVEKMQATRGEPVLGRISHYRHSPVGISEMLRLQSVVKEALSSITIPTLLIFSEKDTVVPVKNLDLLKVHLVGVSQLETELLRKSDHVVTNDVEYDEVRARIEQFIGQLESSRQDKGL